MGVNYTCRGYEAGDEYYIVPLLVDVFKGWPRMVLSCSPLEHWRWKYLDNPYCMTLSSVATHNNRIIGAACQYPIKIKVEDEWTLGSYAADMGIDKEFWNLGVSKKLVEQNYVQLDRNNVDLVYFVTSNPFLIKSYARDYHEFPYKIANMVKIKDINMHLKHIPVKNTNLMKIGYEILRLYHQATNPSRIKYPDIPVNEKVDGRFDQILYKLLEENSHYKFILDKSSKFIRWRFTDPRAGNYLIKYVQDEYGSGYIIIGINKTQGNYAVGYIVDLLATPGRTDLVNCLVKEALEYLDGLNINTVSCLVTKHHPYEKVLSKHGFLDSRIKLHLFTNLNHLDKEDLLMNHPPEKIHFTYAGIDTLPLGLPDYVELA